MEIKYYNQKGKEAGTIELPDKLFNLPWNPDLIREAIVAFFANARQPYAHTKTRGEVRGGGKKPWRQKGLGRARHGSIRSPIWIGGGVSHGPRNEKIYERKINKKTRQKALLTALSQKTKDGEMAIFENIEFEKNKTKEARKFLENMSAIEAFKGWGKNIKTLLILDAKNKNRLAFQNLPNIAIESPENINIAELLNAKFVIFPKKEIERFKEIFKKRI